MKLKGRQQVSSTRKGRALRLIAQQQTLGQALPSPDKPVLESVPIDISGYVGYDGEQTRIPAPLSHLRRLAGLIPRQENVPPNLGTTAEGPLSRKNHPSCK